MTALVRVANKVGDRLTSKDSPDFKPIKYTGAGLTVIGLIIEGVALFTPAMPAAVLTLSGHAITIGLALFGVSAYTKDHSAEEPSVTKGLSGIKKIIAIVKNLMS